MTIDIADASSSQPTGPDGDQVVMLWDPVPASPRFAFPRGYTVRPLEHEGNIRHWTAIQKDAEPYLEVTDDLFMSEFGEQLETAWKRCFLIFDEKDNPVGTISAWPVDDFMGSPHGQLHWLAIRPSHSGKGLAKAATSYVLDIFEQEQLPAFLHTQSQRLVAIRLYKRFGFRPSMETEQDREIWRRIESGLAELRRG